MIEIGQYNRLEILRETSVGLYLGDEEGEDVLLPNKYCPDHFEIGDMITVFVYRDYAERKIATDLIPHIYLHQFALLECVDVTDIGAFMEWGLQKHLMVPFKEQRQEMTAGRWYVVYLDLDTETDRLYGSNRFEKWINNETLTVQEKDEVEVLIYRKTQLGYLAIINNKHKGLLYKNEVFKELRIGEKRTAFIKKIREENKIDLSLQPIGYKQFNSKNAELIYKRIEQAGGMLYMTDKSDPDDIYDEFAISKKAFKKAVGELYKNRKITIEKKGLRLVKE